MCGKAYPVGLDKAHKHGEEDGGGSRLGVLPKELHRLVEGILEWGQNEEGNLGKVFPKTFLGKRLIYMQ